MGKYIYGPVNSRRLGLSLGVSLTPYKICNLDCVYCQLGRTSSKTILRKEYIKLDEIIAELKDWIKANPSMKKKLKFITLSGFGEPTLHSKIKEVIREIKKITKVPLAMITNAAGLSDKKIRGEVLQADLIVPSLDAAEEEIFEKIDRPHQKIKIRNIIDGLVALRKEFKGKIWLEIMLVKGINDSLEHAKKLKEAINLIKPDRIQLNTPVRSTAEENVVAPDKNRLSVIKKIIGAKAEVY